MMKKTFVVSWVLLFPFLANAFVVNRLNGGGSIRYVDFSIPSSFTALELVRTYNSITAINENTGWLGAFGWGWTSPFETTLTTTPERFVYLRDGNTGNTIIFKPEKIDPRAQEEFYVEFKRVYFEREKKRKLSPAELSKLSLPDRLVSQLKTDPRFRFKEAQMLGIQTKVPQGDILISSEYGYQTVEFKNNQWTREKDGVVQTFDKDGRLIRQTDVSGFFFNLKYSDGQNPRLAEISDATKSMILKFSWRGDRVAEVTDNKSQKSKYTYDNAGNLVSVTDSLGHVFNYKYENRKFPHLMTKIEYASEGKPGKEKPYREMRYDEAGLVVYHREKNGSEIKYLYGRSQNDPENNFWTKEVASDGTGKTVEQFYDFFVRPRADGTKYLNKQVLRVNGAETTTVYTQCCGKPQQTISAGKVTNYRYNENGMLVEKVGPTEDLKITYGTRWRKPVKVVYNGLISNYDYDGQGNLVRAMNNKNAQVALKYDKYGHITEMTDIDGRKMNFKYNDAGKPTIIAEQGVGAIKIDYSYDGTIEKTETTTAERSTRKPSAVKSQEVVRKVMKGFQNLLDILRPAGMSLENT